jgi:hypothetical protein
MWAVVETSLHFWFSWTMGNFLTSQKITEFSRSIHLRGVNYLLHTPTRPQIQRLLAEMHALHPTRLNDCILRDRERENE